MHEIIYTRITNYQEKIKYLILIYDSYLSDFEDNENRSIEKIVEIMKTIRLYQFQPEQEVSETDTDKNDTESFEGEGSYDENAVRAGYLNMCLCLKCIFEEREIDCLRCQVLAALHDKLDVEKMLHVSQRLKN